MAQTFDVQQNIFKDNFPSIHVVFLQENALNEYLLDRFLQTVYDGIIGLAPVYDSKCNLVALAASTLSQVLIIHSISTSKVKASKSRRKNSQLDLLGRDLLRERIFCNDEFCKYAFRMDRLSAALYLDLDARIRNAVDMLSVNSLTISRLSLDAFMGALGGETTLNRTGVEAVFKNDENVSASLSAIALQAWASCKAATLPSMEKRFARIARIDTQTFSKEHLTFLCKTVRDADFQVAIKPTKVKNEVNTEFSHKNGTLHVESTRFKTRLRKSPNQILEVETIHMGRRTAVTGRATSVNGRAVTIDLKGAFSGGAIHSISTIGRDDPTQAEGRRTLVVLNALQNTNSLLKFPFIRKIWFPAEVATLSDSSFDPVPLYFDKKPLNPSQMRAISAIFSPKDSDALTVIHGPPGTGKTTVIAAAVVSITQAAPNRAIWLVARSNVAVKNIAEKLAEVDFLQFRILVSKDFHYDWHEHLYEKINPRLIRSDSFVDDIVAADRQLLDSRVILCTLSTLSNDRIAVYSRLAPVETVIIDEASQIEVGDYVHMISRFQQTMRKLVFIGDPKQLAPYGHEEIPDLQSIFEKPHLKKKAILLDTQYRMPKPVGDFISRKVYGGQLRTVHPIISGECCWFVDIPKGVEMKAGNSWKNDAEADAVIYLVRKYTEEGMAFRIITPYDIQTTLLEARLKEAGLPWEDKCFNIDSFQGNEDKHIIVSLVRSQKTGFLTNMRRTNVLLTRFKRSMVICTSRNFVHKIAKGTLVGKLAEELGAQAWLTLP